jgi:hypothetical protein
MNRRFFESVASLALALAASFMSACQRTDGGSGSSSSGPQASSSGSEVQPKRGTGVFAVREKFKVQEQLRNLGVAYIGALTSGKPPRGEDELKSDLDPRTLEWIKEGYFVVYWGVDPANLPNASETVLAYENVDIEGGRFVLLAGGAVKRMDKKEFDAAPKAKK